MRRETAFVVYSIQGGGSQGRGGNGGGGGGTSSLSRSMRHEQLQGW